MMELGVQEPKMKKMKKSSKILSDNESPESDGETSGKAKSKISDKRKGKR